MYLLKIVWCSNFASAIVLFWKKMVYFMTFNLFVMNCTIFVISTMTRYNVQLSWRFGKSARKQRLGPIVYNFILICCEWNKRVVVWNFLTQSNCIGAYILLFYTPRASGEFKIAKNSILDFSQYRKKIVLLGFLPDICLQHGKAQCV